MKPQDPPYGGIAREDRIEHGGDGPWCDKAWHLDFGEKVPAAVTLTCAICGRVYARCAACNVRWSARESMAAHFAGCYRGRRRRNIYGE